MKTLFHICILLAIYINTDSALAQTATIQMIDATYNQNQMIVQISCFNCDLNDTIELNFALENEANWIALSFVRSAKDVQEMADIIGRQSVVVVLDVKKTLVALKKARYAIVQIQTIDEFTDDSKVARYVTNGDVPNANKGFLAGDLDKVIFEKAELLAGVNFVSNEAGKSFKVIVQFYEK